MSNAIFQTKHIAILVVLGVTLLLAMPVHAQSDTSPEVTDSSADSSIIVTDIDVDVSEESEELIDTSYRDLDVDQEKQSTSAFGLFFRNLRERVTINLTFDPVKKAEKQIKFAEERLLFAKQVVNSEESSEAEKARANSAIDRAESLLAKVEEKKEVWLEKKSEKTDKFIENLAKSELRRERILNDIESKLPEDKLENFQEKREKILQKQQVLFEKLEEQDLPEQAKLRVLEARKRLLDHQKDLNSFLLQKRELLEKAKLSDDPKEARQEVKALILERKEERKQDELDREDKKQDLRKKLETRKSTIIKKSEAGDEDASEKLEILKKLEIKENQEEKRAKIREETKLRPKIIKARNIRGKRVDSEEDKE